MIKAWIRILTFSLFSLVLSGCLGLQIAASPSPVPSHTITLPPPTPTRLTPIDFPSDFEMTLTAAPTKTPTKPPVPENILTYRPLTIQSDIPADIDFDQALVLETRPPSILYFSPDRRSETIDTTNGYPLSTSPDGKWLALTKYEKSTDSEWLIIKPIDQRTQYRISLEGLSFWSAIWTDSQHLLTSRPPGKSAATSMVLLDPFTGNRLELSSDYPDFYHTVLGVMPNLNFDRSDVIYSPNLDLVLFPNFDRGQPNLVLWDRIKMKPIARMETPYFEEHIPLWSPDSSFVALAERVETPEQGTDHITEWFMMNATGEIQQITHFQDYFSDVKFIANAMSPDAKKIAFWLETKPSDCPGSNLAVLDMNTRQVINTCLHRGKIISAYPAWSLDSRYVVINNTDTMETILIDTNQWWAALIPEAQGADPVGWLAVGP